MNNQKWSFCDIVIQEFSSCCARFHFHETESRERMVRFESKAVYVIFFQTRFNEVEVAFGPLVEEKRRPGGFGIFDLLHSVDKDLAARSRARIEHTPEGLREAIQEIVKILQVHGQDVLSGQRRAYEALAAPRTSEIEVYALGTVAVHVRPKAEAAFRSGDYAKAAELYQSIRSVLTAVELRKLAIAEKKMRDDTPS